MLGVRPLSKAHYLIAGAWAIHVASWFLPAIKLLSGMVDPLHGWEAFLASASVLLPHGADAMDWYGRPLSVVGVVSTVLFILASPWVVRRGSRFTRCAAALIAAASFLVNLQWIVVCMPSWTDLRIGYFLWCFSFALLAAGLFDLTRASRQPAPAPQPI